MYDRLSDIEYINLESTENGSELGGNARPVMAGHLDQDNLFHLAAR